MVATAIAAIGTAAGIGLNLIGQSQASSARDEALAYQSKKDKIMNRAAKQTANINIGIEGLKQKLAGLDYQRHRREIIRNTFKAQGESANRAANSGALYSSGYQGSRANIVQESGLQQLALFENKEIGDAISDKHKQLYKVQARAGVLGTNLNTKIAGAESKGLDAQALGNLGNMLFQNAETLGRVGHTAISGANDYFNNPWYIPDEAWGTTIGNYGSQRY